VVLVFGEVHFYTRLSIARRYTTTHPPLGVEEETEESEWVSDDDFYSWSRE
jgi:hypothetical protein